jgi:hypothetical protein
VRKGLVLTGYSIIGWGVCGATILLGRRFLSINTTLLVHAVVAPVAFGILAWLFFKKFSQASPAAVAAAMVGIVIALDALVVAPLFERSYAMFQSLIGTWIPFASILAAAYIVGRMVARRHRS